jgi:preprotein translocase subunit SecD
MVKITMVVVVLLLVLAPDSTPRSGVGASVEVEATPTAAPVALELVFAARPPSGASLDPQTAIAVRATLERRMAGLGLTGGIWRLSNNQIMVRVDATHDPARVARVLAAPTSIAFEIIDPRGFYLAPGTIVSTSLDSPERGDGERIASLGAVATSGGSTPYPDLDPVYETIVSGADLSTLRAITGNDGVTPAIGFELQADAARRLHDYTNAHVGQPMSIAIDKRVVFSPTIAAAISTQGIIEGLTPEEVADLVARFEAGVLAVQLDLVETRVITAPADVAPPAP